METLLGPWQTGLPSPANLLARVTVLLALAALITWAFRARAASMRHLLWTTTFLLLLGLPLAILWLPALELRVLPDAISAALGADQPWIADSGSGASSTTIIVLLLWLLGSCATLSSLVAGVIRFATWARTGQRIHDPEWLEAAAELCQRLGIRREVRLVTSPMAQTPMVGGIFRPAILLPQSAQSWPADRREVVLTHELIHVQRHDALRQLLSSLVLALYWFHPLSWLAARLAVASREQACDESVLQLGAQPSNYASHLLELAQSQTEPSTTLSLSLVQRSQLETRIFAILQPRPAATSPSIAAVLCLLLIVCGVATAVALPVSDSYSAPCPYTNKIPD